MLVRCRSTVLTFPSSFQQLAMFGRQRLLLLMPHFCPSVSTFVQDLAPLSTAAWAAACRAACSGISDGSVRAFLSHADTVLLEFPIRLW